ncbi:M15 family metallopeptidase [Brevibacterium ravenspurgense]|uniref:M15 family metallopeptidase n=1 Tax=Brevibacterium ravenspurgense TaxID=479117 RepID=UPI001EF3A3DC|nr:M15 family metallopeptidase [Brevibacterium ravenspurgense]
MDAGSNGQPMRRRDIRRAEKRSARRAKFSFMRRPEAAPAVAEAHASDTALAPAVTAPVAAATVRGSDGSRLRAYRMRRRLAGSSVAAVAALGVIGGGFAVMSSSLGSSAYAKAEAFGDAPDGLRAEAVDGAGGQGGDSTSGQDSSLSGGVLSSEGGKAHAASRTIERTALPGCSGEAPTGEAKNGELPDDWMCKIGKGGHKLRADAAVAFAQMNAAYKADTGKDLEVTDSYRPIGSQQAVAASKPGLAAKPGTSMHGWGIAVDFGGGAETASGQQYDWLVAHAGEYGWENPDWAKSSKYEPWHWEYVPARKMIKGH